MRGEVREVVEMRGGEKKMEVWEFWLSFNGGVG